MKSHKAIAMCLLFGMVHLAQAQDQKSIGAAGGNATGAGGSVSYSVGQVAYTTVKSVTGSVAQGIQDVSISTILPVTLISFSGECQGNSVKLNWETATETNNSFFNVEKSMDASNWTSIATIKGANTTAATHAYNYMDALPNATATYYRLKQVDADGKSSYSQIVYVLNCGNNAATTITLYPNPASEGVYVNTNQFAGLNYSLYDLQGKLISTAKLLGNTTFIELSNLAKAVYIIKITAGTTNVQTFRIYKN